MEFETLYLKFKEFDISPLTSTSPECDDGFKNNIDELGFTFQLDLKSLYNLAPKEFLPSRP